ncbi:MAG: fibronectin type III domain-containing protein [Bdellovibrionaceae bacterium]|nr:fibronectin type III domain-containing protein [Pseudobdellovibrionaceae bacterium]NUM58858.1 fibronectin type III domain-containing protein [Pseudobdellovibrionaceae bacterium]
MSRFALTAVSFFMISLATHSAFSSAADKASNGNEHGSVSKAKHDPGSLFPQPKQNKDKSTPPAKTTLGEPAFMAKISGPKATLKWSAVSGAENYHLQVATDPNFKWLKVDDQFQKNTTYELTGLEAGKSYYWRVAAVKNSNDSMYIKGDYEKSMFEVSK